MEPLSDPTNTVWSFPFTPQDWEQTPLAVQAYVRNHSGDGVGRMCVSRNVRLLCCCAAV
jgi:hypothetical protein